MTPEPSPASTPHVVVVGGGLAGLTAARALLVARPGTAVTVLEGAALVGGKLRLGEVAGVPVDLGAESMLARRPEGTELAAAVGLAEQLVSPAAAGAGVWTRGSVRPLPPTVMGVPANMAVAAASGVLTRRGALRAALERRLPRPDLEADVAFGVLVGHRLGPEVRDRLVDPLLGGVYAGRSERLSAHATMPDLVAATREHGSLLAAAAAIAAAAKGSDDRSATPRPVFAGISGGVGRLACAVASDVERRGGTVRCGALVREVQRRGDRWLLVVGETRRPEVVEADTVVLAVPAAPAARLLGPAVPVAARELGRIEYASLAVVTLAVRSTDVAGQLTGTGFLVPAVDARTIKAATYSSRKWAWQRGDVALFRCSIGRHGDEAELQRTDAELVEAAAWDLREAIGLRTSLVDAVVTRWGGGLPQYAVGHLDRVAVIREQIDAVPGLEICGAALDGVGIPAVVASGQAAATRIADRLAGTATMGP